MFQLNVKVKQFLIRRFDFCDFLEALHASMLLSSIATLTISSKHLGTFNNYFFIRFYYIISRANNNKYLQKTINPIYKIIIFKIHKKENRLMII